MRSTILAAASLAVLASACASGGAGAPPPDRPTTIDIRAGAGAEGWGVGGIDTHMAPDRTVTATTIPGAPAQVLEATQQAYLRLGIPVTVSDPVSNTIGSAQFRPGRRFLDRPMSAYVQCGNDQMGASLADKYQVTMDVRTVLVATADGNTEARTTLAGTARDRSGAGDGFVRCGTRGVLEQRIGTTIQLMVSGAAGAQ